MLLSRSTMRFAALIARKNTVPPMPDDLSGGEHRSAAVAHAKALSLLQQTGLNIIVGLVGVLAVAITVSAYVPPALLMAWTGSMLLGSCYIGQKYLRGRKQGLKPHHAAKVLRRASWSASLYGLLWGFTALFLNHLGWEQQVVLIVIATGLCAGAASSMAASPPAATGFMLGLGVPYVVQFILQFSLPHMVLAVMALLLLMAMSYSARMAYAALIEGIHAQYSARAMARAL
jgi:hypothetical protein